MTQTNPSVPVEPSLAQLRRQLEALRSSIATLQQANLDTADLQQKVTALQQQITHIEGAQVQGNVEVQNGDFVGRDKVLVVLGDLYQGVPLDQIPPKAFIDAYYRHLAQTCRLLPLGVVDPRFADPSQASKVTLHQVYVGLDVVSPVREEGEADHAWGLRLSRGDGEERTPLLEALSRPAARLAVLLGDPGSGKTTFVNYLTYRLAGALENGGSLDDGSSMEEFPESLRGLWPLRLVLRDVAAELVPDKRGCADLLWSAVERDMASLLGPDAAKRLRKHLQEHILQHGGLFLLDGLDEVPEAGQRRACLLASIKDLVTGLPQNARVLLTARPYAYADPAWHLPDFPVLALAPFNDRQVENFVQRWYQAVQPAMAWDAAEADRRSQELAGALERRTYLADLASRPLLLTLMATLHTSWGHLPEDRADLYEESVKLLLARWQRARPNSELEPGIALAFKVGEPVIRAALEKLAFETHTRQYTEAGQEAAQSEPADISQSAVLAAFASSLADDVNPRALLPYLENRAGLLLSRREGVYAFPHRSFQEYLAACHLANTEMDFAHKLRSLVFESPTWWREVFLLGVGKKRQGGLGDAMGLLNVLVPSLPGKVKQLTDFHWQAAAIAAEALLELRLQDELEERPDFQAVFDRIRDWLVALVEGGELAPRERCKAGDLLGRLGDPRAGVASVGEDGVPEILWVGIPAGPFLMGSTEEDSDAYGDERPQHTLDLPVYYISRYPVTNAQFRPFVQGDGYTNPDYWTAAGWAWRNGAEADLSVLEGLDKDVIENHRSWLAGRPVERRDRPFWWNHSQVGIANRPVVGITWYEAWAYTRWLERRLLNQGDDFLLQVLDYGRVPLSGRYAVRLPNEPEWEKAARGDDGRRWPWGNEPNDQVANIKETEIGETSAVGVFPGGVSPYGVLDMAGNVWEWTRSSWGNRTVLEVEYGYPYVVDDGRENVAQMKIPVLRGGSWSHNRRIARCAYRSWDYPSLFSLNIGFRLVVSLVDSDF